MNRRAVLLFALLALGRGDPAAAALDLGRAGVHRLDNGLTVIVLEEHSLPVVSVQMLYRVGARDETAGRTGLAHYLEHMAFRASEHFPDSALVSSIYAVGGEWHGYTWTDQTTYFATVPSDSLDLLLRIEADRMGRLTIPADEVEAERGSVLAELHSYENDPSATLYDYTAFTALLAHPYRNNTIGFASDVEQIDRHDLLAFYRRHYVPANAVLSVVGDVSAPELLERVTELFGDYPAAPATPLPRALEPPQTGERRFELHGAGEQSYFQIAYQAPSVRSPDYAAMLLLQSLLGGSSGVNFRQGFGGHAVEPGSALDGAVENLQTWYPPSAQPYLFTLSGSVGAVASSDDVERAIEERIAALLAAPIDAERLAAARAELLTELLFDVETHEDAAHQLAFFDGLHALDVLLDLPRHIERVTAEQVRDVGRRYLAPQRRTIGWYRAGGPGAPADAREPATIDVAAERPAGSASAEPPSAPVVATLANGLPAIVQRMALTPTCHVRLVLRGRIEVDLDSATDEPIWGHSTIGRRCRADALAEIIAETRRAVAARPVAAVDPDAIADPEARLRAGLEQAVGLERDNAAPPAPVLIVVVGDIDSGRTIELLEQSFGDVRPAPAVKRRALSLVRDDLALAVPRAAQAQLGYVVPAPSPADPQSLAWRLLLYVLSHDYEGRLGKEAISDRGLVYFIDARYEADGGRAWVSLATGVDAAKLETMQTTMRATLQKLRRRPPSEAELAEAKRHLLGRRASAAISNEEISAALARDWLWHGELIDAEQLRTALQSIDTGDLQRIARAFAGGRFVSVTPR